MDNRCLLDFLEPRRLFSLTHLYTFNDATGSDFVGNANATLFNGAVVANGKLQLQNAGLTSNAATLQYARLPNGILPASGSATIEVWYNTNSATPTWMRVFDFGNGSSGQSYLFYSPKGSTGNARTVIRDVGGADRLVEAAAPANQGYTNMAAVVVDASAGTISLYLNGALASSTPLAGIDIGAVNETLAYLGRSQYSADPGFSGSIDELRIYDDARTATNIAADKAAGPAKFTTAYQPPKQVEKLDRGLLAMPSGAASIYINWRLLATDPANVGFNLYRSSNNGAFTKINATPIVTTTDYLDTTATRSVITKYFLKPVINGVEQTQSETYTFAAGFANSYLSIPLQAPPGGTSPDGVAYTYNANDGSVGDVDGDGQYELFLKWDPTNSHDNSQSGYTGNTYLDCYKLNGTRLWRIDEGQNIRAGAHYTQFMVYDLNGDGKAEVAMRTAPGTKDGLGNYVTMNGDDPTVDYRNSAGYNLTSPEYLTIFNGQTGAQMVSTAFHPDRVKVDQWGDTYGNRVDRLLMAVAYLDGQHPSLVIGRGIFGGQSASVVVRNEIVAYDYRGNTLTQRWWFKANRNINNDLNSNYVGQGTYDMQPSDVDGDGKDEIVYGAMTIDDDGRPLYSTGLGHGDALHTSDMDPTRPGMEVFMPEEAPADYGPVGGGFRDAATGEVIYAIDGHNADVGRGVAFDVDPRTLGYEGWDSSDGFMYDVHGNQISVRPGDYNFGVWWDADPLRELLDANKIDKWNWNTASLNRIVTLGTVGNNGTKNTPTLSGDILGDWREEVVERTSDNTELRIYSTTIKATNRLVTLMQDVHYREAIAWQNVGYNQPPHPSFYLGDGMSAPPAPNVYLAGIAPAVQSFSVNGGGAQRSMVKSLVVTFNTVVTLAANAFNLSLRLNGGGSSPVDFTLSNPSQDGLTYVISFANPSLADGAYALTVFGTAVANVGGVLMPNDQSYSFYRLLGDLSGDGSVGDPDLNLLLSQFGTSTPTTSQGDVNGDGVVNDIDLNILITNFGNHV